MNNTSRDFENKPFLSVLIITDGRCPDMLRECLLSLQAQTDNDFEMLLIAHKTDDNHFELIRKIINEFPGSFSSDIRLLNPNEHARSAALNAGLSHARGSYISVLDDNNICFDNWVEEFHKAADAFNGKIIKTGVLTQKWDILQSEDSFSELRAVSKPDARYCEDFDFFDRLAADDTPASGFAFPSDAFAYLTSVHGIKDPTCIYRDFKASYDISSNCRLPSLKSSSLYLNDSAGYSESKKAFATPFVRGSFYECIFEFDDENDNALASVRFDICEEGFFGIEDFSFSVLYADGSKIQGTLSDINAHNGIPYKAKEGSGIWYKTKDPQIEIALNNEKQVKLICIKGLINTDLPDEFDIVPAR